MTLVSNEIKSVTKFKIGVEIVEIILKSKTVEEIETFSQIVGKTPSQFVEDAIEAYISAIETKMAQDSLNDDNANTNLSYDEFWDGVDL